MRMHVTCMFDSDQRSYVTRHSLSDPTLFPVSLHSEAHKIYE